ncbi:protein of unknown function [Hyphomicrobium sp. 1Nfss2.1]|uniref:hypothetical protein n=1 Tax=Hyphomicrobium sp. 1Nfss2.1 TaxID=3413936 RepID=UPI003C7B5B7E
MRRFLCLGGRNDGQELSVAHGNVVWLASTGERYRVYSEPVGHYLGALVPQNMPDDDVEQLLEEKLPWYKSKRE